MRDNTIVERRYLEIDPVPIAPDSATDGESSQLQYKWVESGEQLGTHQEGAPAKSMDELYLEAQSIPEAGPSRARDPDLTL